MVGSVEIGKFQAVTSVFLITHHLHEGLIKQHLGDGVVVMGMDGSIQDFIDSTERDHDVSVMGG
jgi:hypothetical protein